MDWDYPQGAGPEGIFEIGRRLAEHIGRIPDATTFTNDAREMLRLTRRVEAEARGGRLFVGFQNARKLELERARYESLVADGTQVVFTTSRGIISPSIAMTHMDAQPMPDAAASVRPRTEKNIMRPTKHAAVQITARARVT